MGMGLVRVSIPLRKLHENIAWNGRCGGALAGDRLCFGAERKHDEWCQLGWRLDGGYDGIWMLILLVIVVAAVVVWVVKRK